MTTDTVTLDAPPAEIPTVNRFRQATLQLWKREVLRFARQRSRWIGALATPLLFWMLIGGGLGDSFHDPSGASRGGYLEFFFPGAIVLSVLFTAIFSTMSVIEDRHEGFLQGILVAPVSRGSFVAAKILGGATLGVIQALLLLALAPFAGIALTFMKVLWLVPLLFLMGAALTALGFVFAWKIDSVQGYHGVMNIVLVPMWILSGAVFPGGGSFRVFKWLTAVNPLSYGVTAFRDILQGTGLVPNFGPWLVLAVFLAVLSAMSVFVVNQRDA